MRLLFATANAAVAQIARTLARFAPTDLPILIEGETGCGKSYVARALHRRGRPRRPLVVVDCGAIPESLVASELFGHSAGAFTDATRTRAGRLAQAADGSVVLDRLDALPPAGQVALLRALEERVLQPVGGGKTERLRARVIALVGTGIAGRIHDGTVRADLYHRLAGFHATLPALRERCEDILPFARRALRSLARRHGGDRTLSADACHLLLSYPWPGNFRELETVLERAWLASDADVIDVAHLSLGGARWNDVMESLTERSLSLHEVSRVYALWVLARQGGNVSRAARVLGISRRTLIRWRQQP